MPVSNEVLDLRENEDAHKLTLKCKCPFAYPVILEAMTTVGPLRFVRANPVCTDSHRDGGGPVPGGPTQLPFAAR